MAPTTPRDYNLKEIESTLPVLQCKHMLQLFRLNGFLEDFCKIPTYF